MPPSENINDDDNVDVATNNLTSRFNDMFAASPSSLRKISSSPSSSRKEYPIHVADDGEGKIRDVSRFASMFSASPAELKKSREQSSLSSPLPSIARVIYDDISTCKDDDDGLSSSAGKHSNSFEDMFLASPAALRKIGQTPHNTPVGREYTSAENIVYHSMENKPEAPPLPVTFEDMFSASPKQLKNIALNDKLRIHKRPVLDSLRLRTSTSNTASVPSSSSYSLCDRFEVKYLLLAKDEEEAKKITLEICLEQTVELPESLVPEGTWIREHVVGRCEKLSEASKCLKSRAYCPSKNNVEKNKNAFEATVSYHSDCAGNELTQLINVIFGNTSIKEDVMVVDVKLPHCILKDYPGPRFGSVGLRRMLGVHKGPLLMTALKPMGSSADELAEFAYQFALGGIDVIKDDHGLADQPYAPFEERVKKCSEAVRRANSITGRRCVYAPCLNAPAHLIIRRAFTAKDLGVGAVLMIPGITGLDACRELAADDSFKLPIIAHPAILGSMLGGGTRNSVRGFAHEVLLGVLPRIAGCDMTIFPTFGGRFGFSKDECLGIKSGCERGDLENMPSIVLTPGGGMTMERVKTMRQAFGDENLCLLIGGSLYGAGKDLAENARGFLKLAGREDLYGPFEENKK
jgi:ribulose-bisphosphate carboxylase large chain